MRETPLFRGFSLLLTLWVAEHVRVFGPESHLKELRVNAAGGFEFGVVGVRDEGGAVSVTLAPRLAVPIGVTIPAVIFDFVILILSDYVPAHILLELKVDLPVRRNHLVFFHARSIAGRAHVHIHAIFSLLS